MTSTLDPRLLDLLVCPEDKQQLWFFADRGLLYNERLQRVYEVRNNIPILLVDDARTAEQAEHDELLGASSAAVRTGPAQ